MSETSLVSRPNADEPDTDPSGTPENRLAAQIAAPAFAVVSPDCSFAGHPATLIDIAEHGACISISGSPALPEEGPLAIAVDEAGPAPIPARVVWIRQLPAGALAGLRFPPVEDSAPEASSPGDSGLASPDHYDRGPAIDRIPAAYKLLSVELLDHLADLRSDTRDYESARSTPERRALAGAFLATRAPDFQDIWFRFNDVTMDMAKHAPEYRALKHFTEKVITPCFMGAPVWARSYGKPRGYPGDYKIMDYAYNSDRPTQAPSLHDEILHLYLSHTLGACIRGRMELTLDAIRGTLEHSQETPETPFSILNLGCGAAVELPLLLAGDDMRGRHLEISLLDHDAAPLSEAFATATRAARHSAARVVTNELRMSFADIMKLGRSRKDITPKDVIYSLGLIDYLRAPTARALARDMWALIKPGGALVWCNVSRQREGCEWPLECITDWSLQYRSRQEMLDIFDLPGAQVSIDLEPSRQIWVVTARKPEDSRLFR